MGKLLVKAGVDFGPGLAPGGARMLCALKRLVKDYEFDITITSSRDGKHSGQGDPHHHGNALDIRTKNLTNAQKARLVADLQTALYRPIRRFYVFLEDAGGVNEHIHMQVRRGTTYSTADDIADL